MKAPAPSKPEQSLFQGVLRRSLLEAQARRPNYSLRAHAKKLGISPAGLSELLKGRRRVSIEMAKSILEQLEISPIERQTVLDSLFGAPGSGIIQYSEMDMEQYHLISEWYHAGILSLVQIKGFKGDPGWIAKRLGITRIQAERALVRLVRLKMLKKLSNNSYQSTGHQYRTSDHVSNPSLRQAHSRNLDLARRALEQVSIEERDFTAITMAIDPDRLPEAKKMIRRMRDELCSYLEGGTKKEVYKLCVQMFPLTETKN